MKYRTIVLTGLLVGLANLALAQGLRNEAYYNWNLLGAGARARAMGGAFLAVSDDGSAATWNPAGLPYNEGILTSLNWNFVHAAVENNPLGGKGIGEASGNSGSIGYWSFVAPITLYEHEFVSAVTYQRQQDIFYEDALESPTMYFPPIFDTASLDTRARSVGNLANINLGFGTEVFTNLTFGMGINLAGGDRKDNYIHRLITREYEVQGLVFADTITLNLETDVDYTGFHANFGLMYRTDKWSAALVYSTPWELTEKLYDSKSTQAGVHVSIPMDSTIILFNTERKVEVPYSIGIGGSYRLTERLLIAADYQYRGFKGGNIASQQVLEPDNSEVGQKGILSPASPFVDYPTEWYNLHQFRIGAEYILESGYGRIPLRAGFHNVPSVAGNTSGTKNYVVAYYLNPLFDVMVFPGTSEAQQDMGLGFAFGSGIHWSQIHLDFAFEFEFTSSSDDGEYWYTWFGPVPGGVGSDYQTVKLGEYERDYKHTQSRFLLNFTGYF